jgi:hypothetical protein
VAGFAADLPAIGATAKALRTTADSVAAAVADLDPAPCADLGPGRLGPVAAALVTGARADLDRVLGAVATDADRAEQARDSYAELDTETATRFDRRSW